MAKKHQNIDSEKILKDNFDNVSNLWSDFSSQMENKLQDLFESSAHEYKEIYQCWTNLSDKMSKQMMNYSMGDEMINNNLYNSWKEYSEQLNTDLVKFSKGDDKTYSEFLDFWTNYSDKFNDQLSNFMREGLKEQFELYELWMDSFAKTADEGSKTGDIPSIMNKYWLQSFNRFNDFYSKQSTIPESKIVPETGEQLYNQYKEMHDYWVDTSQKMLDELMRSSVYGNFIAQSINTSMDSQKMMEKLMTQNYKTLGIPSKNEVEEIRLELHNISERLDNIDKTLKDIKKK